MQISLARPVTKINVLLFLQQNHQPSTSSQQAVRRKHPSNADNRPTTSHLHFKRLIKKRAENKFHFRHYEQLLHSNAMLFQQPMSKFQHRISSQFNFQTYIFSSSLWDGYLSYSFAKKWKLSVEDIGENSAFIILVEWKMLFIAFSKKGSWEKIKHEKIFW